MTDQVERWIGRWRVNGVLHAALFFSNQDTSEDVVTGTERHGALAVLRVRESAARQGIHELELRDRD